MDLPTDYGSLNTKEKRAVREHYIKLQEGKCYHCGEPLKYKAPPHIMDKKLARYLFPKSFFKYPIHLHHDHNTGLTIGAVHCHCNAVLWQYHGE